MACLGFLLCLWEPVRATLLSFLGTAVADCLTSLRDRAVAQVINLTFFWGNQVEPINTSTAHLVGLEEIHGYLEKIAGYLKDDAVGIIGIYGMAGVGKTTLLRMLNNDFHKIRAPGFDAVIWVTVSQDASILKIQKQIGDRLGLSLSADATGSSSQAEEQAKAIFQALFKRRFLLLLDDVWDELDLELVGIPCPTAENNKCKIILTTRSRRVCIIMGAKNNLVDVNILNASESWKLFKENLATEVDSKHRRINPLARAIADKCGGLPLALITVGRAMAEATSVDEWEEALEQLRKTPHKLPGMEDKVLSLLKFSFDRLGDETTRQCLLYCCLFPEDHEIPVEKVIEYWVGEGFLDDTQSESIVRARRRGHGVITKLKSACLLETGWIEYSNVSCVKMHDVVREMCLWLTGGEFDKSNTFLVYAGSDRVPRSERWGEAKRVALMRNSSQALPHNIPPCPKLRTLLCDCFIRRYAIPRGFFECMPALCVLDLSWCRLESLPEEISFLAELRYLNLGGNHIRSLPRGLAELAKLSQLDLDYTAKLSHIPREAIPTLTGLRVLGMYDSHYDFNLLNESPDTSSDGNMGEDTRSCWDRLEELRLTVRTISSLETLLKCERQCLCTTRLQIHVGGDTGITAARVSVALGKLEKVRSLDVIGDGKESEVPLDIGNIFGSNLEELYLSGVPKITVVVSSPCFLESLRQLAIHDCRGIRDLMWVRQLPRLQKIEIYNCEGMEELLPEVNGLEERGVDDEAVDCDRASLLALRRIVLCKLPALKRISGRPLLFPSLEYLDVEGCPQLKKLPLGPDSAQNIRGIWVERDWWESLEWHQDADGRSVKSRFLPYYVEKAIESESEEESEESG